ARRAFMRARASTLRGMGVALRRAVGVALRKAGRAERAAPERVRDLLLAEAAAKAVARVRRDAAQAHDVERQPRRDQLHREARSAAQLDHAARHEHVMVHAARARVLAAALL